MVSSTAVAISSSIISISLNALVLFGIYKWQETLDPKIVEERDYFLIGNMADYGIIGIVSFCGVEIANFVAMQLGSLLRLKQIPVRGRHLDELSGIDKLHIFLNKVSMFPFMCLLLRIAYSSPNMPRFPSEVSFSNVLGPIPLLYIVYDFFYTPFHWFLHINAVYPFIHKHHHTQHAPSRANEDAVNVHPIEFFTGEYIHILSICICSQLMNIHLYGSILFLFIGAIFTAFNHTRFDCVVSFMGYTIFDSKFHDIHHRIPQSNYCQYIILFDRIFGSFRPYDKKDRVNPLFQLDPKTGKSLQYMQKQKAN